jgi:hypothetical protein
VRRHGAITCDDDIGTAGRCALENAVVRIVTQYRCLSAWSFDFGALWVHRTPKVLYFA